MGASIEMYLLDYVRLLKQASGEPNEMFFMRFLLMRTKKRKILVAFMRRQQLELLISEME